MSYTDQDKADPAAYEELVRLHDRATTPSRPE